MGLILVTFTLAAATGYLLRGRLSSLGALRVRWAPLALVGLALQFAPLPGRTLPLAALFVSFVVLTAFAIVNIRVGGFPLILIGVLLNFTVIAVNDGMPVTRQALVASDQINTLTYLVQNGGAKHHLADSKDRLLLLLTLLRVGAGNPIRGMIARQSCARGSVLGVRTRVGETASQSGPCVVAGARSGMSSGER